MKKGLLLLLLPFLLAGCGEKPVEPTNNGNGELESHENETGGEQSHEEQPGGKDDAGVDGEKPNPDPIETKETAYLKMKEMFSAYKKYKGSISFTTHERVDGNIGGCNMEGLSDYFELSSFLTYDGETRQGASKYTIEVLTRESDGSVRDIYFEDCEGKNYFDKECGYTCVYKAELLGQEDRENDTIEEVKKVASKNAYYYHKRNIGDTVLDERPFDGTDSVKNVDCTPECFDLLSGLLILNSFDELLDEQKKINENNGRSINIDVSFDEGIYKICETEYYPSYQTTGMISFVFKNNKFDSFELRLDSDKEANCVSHLLTTFSIDYNFDSDFFDSIVPKIPFEDCVPAHNASHIYFHGDCYGIPISCFMDLKDGFEEAKTITSITKNSYRIDIYLDENFSQPINLSNFESMEKLDEYLDKNSFYFNVVPTRDDCVIAVTQTIDLSINMVDDYNKNNTGEIICYYGVTEKTIDISSTFYAEAIVNGEVKNTSFTLYSGTINVVKKIYIPSFSAYLNHLPFIDGF